MNFEFEKYYAIDQYGSLTDAAQFERFCSFIGIRCERVRTHPLFNFSRLEALYATTEYSFDPYLIARHYVERLEARPSACPSGGTRGKKARPSSPSSWSSSPREGRRRLRLRTR